MSCGIYKITNVLNGKSYIGQSINIPLRWSRHKNFPLEKSNYPLYKAFKKYGIENFAFDILEECSVENLNDREIFWIKTFNSYYEGYNQTLGGQGSSNNVIKISIEDLKIIYSLLSDSNLTQKEIAKMFSVGEDTISEINTGKTRVFEGYEYPIRKNWHNYCPNCGKKITSGAKLCLECSSMAQRKTIRPSREELKDLIRNKTFTQIGKDFNVSDNSIRKWCESYSLPKKAREIKNYTDEEWKLV